MFKYLQYFEISIFLTLSSDNEHIKFSYLKQKPQNRILQNLKIIRKYYLRNVTATHNIETYLKIIERIIF